MSELTLSEEIKILNKIADDYPEGFLIVRVHEGKQKVHIFNPNDNEDITALGVFLMQNGGSNLEASLSREKMP